MSSQLITVADFIQLIKKNNAKVVQQVKGLDLSAKLITAVVPTLPDTGEEGILYFVPKTDGTGNNLYNEYLWIGANSKYEQVGSAEVDLSDYLKSADAANTYAKKTDLSAYAKTSALADYLTATNAANTYATKASLADYATVDALSDYLTVVDAEADYLTKASAASTYLTKTDAANTYATKSSLSDYAKTSALSSYLTVSSASSTYATKASLADYAKTTALSAYMTTEDASDTYLAKTDAASTYATVSALADYAKTSDLSSYLTTSAASNTYATKSSLSNYAKTSALSSYLTTANASSTYLSKTDASNTYATKAALTEAIGGVTSISYSVVSTLPSSGSNGVIYLVPKSKSQANNLYDEYIWLASSSKFEKIGDTAIDLSGYLTTAAASNTYATKSSIPTKVSQLTNDSGYKTTDTNTTYSLTQDSTDGHKLTFAGSDGSSKTITIPDNNTTYSAATQSANGLMTAADKKKLDGIAAGANAYTLPAATASALGGVKVGSNITVSSGTISLTKDNVTAALGYTPPTTNTTYGVATTSANGLMSSTDKSKLDGIATGANNYSLPAATASVLGGVKVGSNITVSSGTISLTKANVTAALGYTPPTKDTDTHYVSGTIVNNSNTATANTTTALTNGNVYLNHIENGTVKNSHKISGSGATSVTTDTSGNIVVSSTNTTYSAATQSANGLMSAADKKKLDGIAAGANNYTYTLPAATASALGGVKVGSNITNSSGTISLTKANVTAALGYTPPTTDTNTHYASGTIVNNSASATANTTAALTNGNVYLNHIENGAVKNSHKISGSGATSVTTDTSGNIVISSTNTTYSAATQSANGLMSAADKKKLDGVATRANAYSLPTASRSTLGGVKSGSSITDASGYTACPIIGGIPYYKPSSVTTTGGADPNIYSKSGINYTGSGPLSWGSNSIAVGDCSAAIGYGVTAPGACSLSIGIYNKDHKQFNGLGFYSWIAGDEMSRDAFTIGNGTSPSRKSNAFRVTFSGQTYGLASFSSSGADYAEYVCEWADGNPDSEDRVGYMVTIKDGKLHKANDGDYILGVTSGNPSVVGNADETYFWKYERDDFNRILYAPIPKLDEAGQECLDEDGNVITINAMKVADNYDPDAEYIPRFIRPEWDYVGMVGVIPVRDDGTCVAGGFCKCGKDGIATAAEKKDFFTYYVKDRVSDGVVNAVIL